MGKARFSDDFKRDAVHQIAEWGYSVAEVSQRLGMSTHSLYGWIKKFSKRDQSNSGDEQVAEIRRPTVSKKPRAIQCLHVDN